MSDNDGLEDLQGSSRTVGGVCRGKAVGNALAFTDLEPSVVDHSQQPRGRVILRVGDSAPCSMVVPVGSDLPMVLNGLSTLYSPIKHHNARISVREDDGGWELRGRFLGAVHTPGSLP